MAAEQRSELEQDMVQSLVESKAVDFEAAGNVLAKFGAAGGISFTVTPKVIRDWCIPAHLDVSQIDLTRIAAPNIVAGPGPSLAAAGRSGAPAARGVGLAHQDQEESCCACRLLGPRRSGPPPGPDHRARGRPGRRQA